MRGAYSHDLFTQRALRFLDRNHQEPFFLYLAYTVPHANNELGRVTGNGIEVPDYGSYADKDWPPPEKGHAAMIERLDRDVGRIVNRLRKLGIDRNSIVFLSSDNGPHCEGGHDPDFFNSRGPLRGIKRDLYEGGIRVPMPVRWPERIHPGQVSDHGWAFWDFLPTVAELVDVPAPAGIDGISMAPTLVGGAQEKHHEFLYWVFYDGGFKQAVRMGDGKGLRAGPQSGIELYHLRADWAEQGNVAALHPEVIRRIEQIMKTARKDAPEYPRES